MADQFTTVRGEIDVGGEAYRLLTVTMREALSEVPDAICEIVTTDMVASGGAPDPKTFIDKPAKLKLERADGTQPREYAGTVVEAGRFADADGRPFVRLRVAPK